MTQRMAVALVGAVMVGLVAQVARAEGQGAPHPWSLSLQLGKLDTEGDACVNDAYLGTIGVDYRFSERCSVEGSVTVIPELTGNSYNDYSSGVPVEVNRLEAQTSASETWAIGAALDVLYHFAPRRELNPYVSVGYGVLKYGEDIGENDGLELTPRVGVGILRRLTSDLALRADVHYFLTGPWEKSESNTKAQVGIVWTPGGKASVPGASATVGGAGAQKTPAFERDVHELHIEFPAGGAELEAQYYEQLDVIAKLLKDSPSATALIEAYCDKARDMTESQGVSLTRKRAEAVCDYLAGAKWKIARRRLEAKGCGFGPAAETEGPDKGAAANRRIVISIVRPAAPAGP